MANTPDITAPCADVGAGRDETILPIDPFHAVRYQFGMLLGVEDFEAAQAYPRGKVRLHNAWLHGEGVVWGFGVEANGGELRVTPGLALDAAGHELHLDQAACLDLASWYEQHKDDPAFQPAGGGVPPVVADPNLLVRRAHVALRFRACLTRPVPSLSEPCEGASTGVAPSRAFETVELRLVPGPAPERRDPYPLLRRLFGLSAGAASTDPERWVDEALAELAALPEAERAAAFLAAFRRFAALDVIALGPATADDGERVLLFPAPDDAPVILANVRLRLRSKEGGGVEVIGIDIDPSVRRAHVATSTIQELNLVPPAAGAAVPTPDPDPDPDPAPDPAPDPDPDVDPAPAAGGPRIDRAQAALDGKTISLRATQPLDRATVRADAFSVTYLDDAGWAPIELEVSRGDKESADVVTLVLAAAPPAGARRLRLVARGTGPAPILG
ncbi:MAG TPA: hypothetical protein VL242_29480, partial [Sorangium sp.]|nr:hypothetical protein [Sorangium sp.]